MPSEPEQTISKLTSLMNRGSGEQTRAACIACGQCATECFLTASYPDVNPQQLVDQVLVGKKQELIDSEFIWACTLCGRCTMNCPQEISMDAVVRELRGLAWKQGKAPARLVEGIETALKVGNNIGMDSEEFVDTIKWLAEEVAEEMEGIPEEGLAVPFDREGAELLYVPNPREYTSNPGMFQTYLKFFTYAGADWTLSSKVFDITNWAYYVGNHEAAVALLRNMVEEARRLGVKTLLSTECGHGFKILRRDAETWLGEPLGFEVISVIELAHKWLTEGRLPIKTGSIEGRVTYHDPCNVGRKLGIFAEPRELIRAVAEDFVELTPSREDNICCGGGGSVIQNTAMGKKRLEYARMKHDQIMSTGADILVTSCQNGLSQFVDLKARYKMPLEVKSVIELLVEAMEA